MSNEEETVTTVPLREQYAIAQRLVVQIERKREILVSHTDIEYLAALEVLREIAEGLPEILGKCETCRLAIFEGDKGYAFLDGEPLLCENHAPTYGEIVQQIEAIPLDQRDAFFGGEEGIGQETLDKFKSKPADERQTWEL